MPWFYLREINARRADALERHVRRMQKKIELEAAQSQLLGQSTAQASLQSEPLPPTQTVETSNYQAPLAVVDLTPVRMRRDTDLLVQSMAALPQASVTSSVTMEQLWRSSQSITSLALTRAT